jgi:hypothetical protein
VRSAARTVMRLRRGRGGLQDGNTEKCKDTSKAPKGDAGHAPLTVIADRNDDML